jgi:hypothetical protein
MSGEASFAGALLHPQRGCPPGLRAHNGSDPSVRFDVYRNNVVVSLVAALAETFGVTRELVGEAFFSAMARQFIAQHPPRSPVLSDYGDALAGFIESFAPAAPVPYLADMARLERARVRAYHAADAVSLTSDEIAAVLSNPAALAESRVAFQPSLQVIDSRYAIVSLWAAHHGHGDIARIDPCTPEAAIVLREDDDAAVIPVPPASAPFFRRLCEGATLVQAAALDASFDLAAGLGVLIRHRALVAWHLPMELCA